MELAERGGKAIKQYCRYCAHMICGDGNYCTSRDAFILDSQAKRQNKCKNFNLNPIDALDLNKKGYVPRNCIRIDAYTRREQISLSDWKETTV